MIEKIILPDNHVRCKNCHTLMKYEVSDVEEFDDGTSLLWYFNCPFCEEKIFVTPKEYMERSYQRTLDILRNNYNYI